MNELNAGRKTHLSNKKNGNFSHSFRNELANIKSGEEHKKKNYRALCLLKVPTTPEIIHKLNIPNGFSVQQKTPLRVLHRRPLLTRPRQIFHVKGQVFKSTYTFYKILYIGKI